MSWMILLLLIMFVCCCFFAGTRSLTEFMCPAGTYFEATGNVRIQDCIACTTGHYCPAGSATPTSCASGTFSNTIGAQVSENFYFFNVV